MSDFTKEIDKGRVVRAFMNKRGIQGVENRGNCITGIELACGGLYDQAVLLVLPPKPLEVTGYVCDEPHDPDIYLVCTREDMCPKEIRQKDNCRKVVLVEKKECDCK